MTCSRSGHIDEEIIDARVLPVYFNSMPLEKSEGSYLRLLASEGLMVSDGTCNVHAGMLNEELDHLEKLGQPHAMEKKLNDIRFRQRQIERTLGYGKSEELRKRAESWT